jgi:hypothetical protein
MGLDCIFLIGTNDLKNARYHSVTNNQFERVRSYSIEQSFKITNMVNDLSLSKSFHEPRSDFLSLKGGVWGGCRGRHGTPEGREVVGR